MRNEFSKQPSEAYTIGLEFLGKLPSGASPSSGTVTAYDHTGTDVSSTVLSGTTATVTGTQVRIKVLSGTHGMDYRLRFLVTLTNADILEEDVLMRVENQ